MFLVYIKVKINEKNGLFNQKNQKKIMEIQCWWQKKKKQSRKKQVNKVSCNIFKHDFSGGHGTSWHFCDTGNFFLYIHFVIVND